MKNLNNFIYSKKSLKNRSFKELCKDEHGASTLEVVIVIAVLLAIALIFNTQIREFANQLFDKVFNDSNIIDQIGPIGS